MFLISYLDASSYLFCEQCLSLQLIHLHRLNCAICAMRFFKYLLEE